MPYSENNFSKAETPEEHNFEVHTMPAKLLSLRPAFKFGSKTGGGGKKPLGFKKNLIIGLTAIVILTALMVLAAWLFLRSVSKEKTVTLKNDTPLDNLAEKVTTPTSTKETLPTYDEASLLDETTWQTRVSAELYYSLKYPSHWQLETVSPISTSTKEALSLIDHLGKKSFEFNVFDNSEKLNLKDWVLGLGAAEADLENFTLSSLAAYKYENKTLGNYTLYVFDGENFFSLIFYQTDDTLMSKIFNRLLINLKLTNPAIISLNEEEEAAPEFAPAVDSDADGLTDVEENLYGSDKSKADTDGDSYSDSVELINLYHPTIAGQARLYESALVLTFINKTYNYNILYPASWQTQGESNSVIFQDKGGEFMQVLIIDNEEGYPTVNDWYRATINPNAAELVAAEIAGLPALKSTDQMRVYFLTGDKVYTLIYNIGLRADANFLTTFTMMQKSLKLMNQ